MSSKIDSRRSSNSETTDILDTEGDQGWEDIEPDLEDVRIISLFGTDDFPDAHTMLQHCKENCNFDLLRIRDEFGL